MNFTLFTDQLQDVLHSLLPSSADMDLAEDEGCHRIYLHTPTDLLRPGIPLEPYYDKYRRGCSLEEIGSRILEVYRAETLRPFFTVGDIADKAILLKNLELRPLSLRHHKKLLSLYPHEIRCGMLFFFTVRLKGDHEKLGASLVTPEMLRTLRVRDKMLFTTALSNMKAELPPVISPLPHYLELLSGRDAESFVRIGIPTENIRRSSLFVLTNAEHRCGACSLFYPGMTEELHERFGSCIILPSSVHEVLILPAKDAGSIRELKRLVRFVNTFVNDTLLILSNELYACDPQKGLHII